MKLTVLACAVVMVLCGACDSGAEPKGDSMTKSEQFSTLLQRPDIEQMQSRYLSMLDKIRAGLVNRFGIAPWQPDTRGPSGSACGADFPDVGADGEIRRYSSGMSPGNLPDAKWADAVAAVAEIARSEGFGEPAVVVDRPSDHEVSLRDKYGAELLFGTARNTTLSVSTGCHLTSAAHRRGTPA
jgi:hypothetical protein